LTLDRLATARSLPAGCERELEAREDPRHSSNSIAIGPPNEVPKTSAFVEEQRSRRALLFVVEAVAQTVKIRLGVWPGV